LNCIDVSTGRKQQNIHIGFANIAKHDHNHPMQLQLDDVALFTRIAELGTLSAAARERDVPVSQVTRAGAPQHPDDLHHHHLLANNANPLLNRWPLADEGKPKGQGTLVAAIKIRVTYNSSRADIDMT
jgi:hypothetical protein